MNSCLAKPCPWGFAYLVAGKYKHHLDYYGAFSYSTTGRISGMEYNATAFVGCDDQACCACYGPLGGTKNYCAEKCKAINGGTVTKKVFTWFWVRSSLPKRLWKKCMEYEVRREDGKMIWYKLGGHSVVPVQGRCGNQTLLHDGIVVVPDSKAAKKVPAIDGLLEYRKDKQELYVRSNKTWNAVAQKQEIRQEALEVDSKLKDINQNFSKQNQRIRQGELEVDSELKDINQKFSKQNQRIRQEELEVDSELKDINQKFSYQNQRVMKKFNQLEEEKAELKQIIENMNETLNSFLSIVKDPRFSESDILSGELYYDQLLKLWIEKTFTAKLCWRATRDGWSSSTFHSKCNYKKPTVTLVKVGSYIFGGYATASWEGTNVWKQAPGSFIFSFRNKENLLPFKAPLKNQNTQYAIHAGNSFGPLFGLGHDIYISNNAASNSHSQSRFSTYQAPSGDSSTSTILAGTNNFSPTELEVFHLV